MRLDADSTLTDWRERAHTLERQVSQVIIGQERTIRLLTIAVFARGHVLLEGDVGVGKTTLLRAMARAIGGRFERMPYLLRWRPRGASAGAHAGLADGSGGAFRQHVPLLRHADPRRIDLRVTLRDPLGEVYVRQFAQRTSIAVMALVDLSGSMRFEGRARRMQVVARLCAILAASAGKSGDRFGLIGCDAGVRADVLIPPTRRRGLESQVFDLLMRAAPTGASAQGLIAAARLLPPRRSLVFLISDFLIPMPQLELILDGLWRHDVVPVVLVDRAEEVELPRWGLIELRDLETRRRRLVVMHPGLRAAWHRESAARHEALEQAFRRHGRTALRVVDGLDVDALSEFLLRR